MDLLSVAVTGFKRFRTKTNVQTNGKLVAILGPNEAGKSSLLEAIAHLGHSGELQPREISRGLDPFACSITGRFYLDQDDLEVTGLEGPRWMTITKTSNGRRTFGFDPPAPPRNIDHRRPFARRLQSALDRSDVKEALLSTSSELQNGLDSIISAMDSEDQTIDDQVIDLLHQLISFFESTPSWDNSSEIDEIVSIGKDNIAIERAKTPLKRAFDAILPRTPKFLFFSEEDRNLRPTYALSDLRAGVPTALSSLLEVAELDISEIFNAIDNGDSPRRTTLERRASRTITKKFNSSWKQSEISVSLEFRENSLDIHIVNRDEEYTSLSERSDGLRQFVALQVFSTRNLTNNPILLIDEAEQRLHYDAQADLVQMLAKQNVSPKVIYTTHSAGCLPEDLGNGVRMVAPENEGETSSVINRFWGRDARGLTPLLYGMGASTLAFFPTRRAVMVEGASDMLLYPTLFRQILGQPSLGFQFVPGLSNIERTMSQETLRDEVGLVYLVDGDEGGAEIASRLKRKGVKDADILVARNSSATAVELEDFIEPNILLSAANKIIDKFHKNSDHIAAADISISTRMSALEDKFFSSTGEKLSKVDLAYEILDIVNSDPCLSIINPTEEMTLKIIADGIIDRFDQQRRSAD